MRLYSIDDAQVAAVIADPAVVADTDRRGNPRWTAEVQGRIIRVVMAADDPELVISVYPRRR